MRRAEIPHLEHLKSLLSYDPETGDFDWRVNRPPAVKAGTPAGTLSLDGTRVITLDGRRYQAHHLAWYVYYGDWPTHQVLFYDKDPANLAIANLRSAASAYSQSKRAAAARERRRRRTERRAQEQAGPDIENAAFRLRYNERRMLWDVLDPVDINKIWKRFEKRADAEAYADDYRKAWEFVVRHPYEPMPGDDTLRAGVERGTETYAEIAERLVYDPETGAFYHRSPDRADLRADFDTTSGRRVVTIFGRYFSVGMLAWFLTHRRWPRPKSIGFRDRNPSNARLSNLYRIGADK